MKLIKFISFILLTLIHFNAYSQIWNKQYDNGGNEYANSITILNDHIFLSAINDNNTSILKLDTDGNIVKGKTFDNTFRVSTILKTSTNELLFICNSKSSDENIVIIKLDQELNIIWSTELLLLNYQFAEAAIENSNGDFTICGYSSTGANSTSTRDGLICRINKDGQFLWYKRYSVSAADYFSGITENNIGNMVLVGAMQGGAGLMDISITQIDNAGNIINVFSWGGTENDGAYSILYDNNSYYISGNTWSAGVGKQDMVLLKLDNSLNQIYAKTYGGPEIEPGLYIGKNSQGKIILGGQSTSIAGKDKDLCLLVLEENGSIINMKNIGTNNTEEVGFGYQFIKEYSNYYYICSSTLENTNNKNIMLSRIDALSIDTCCNIVNNLVFSTTNSNIIPLNTGFVGSSTFNSNTFTADVSNVSFYKKDLCKPDTLLKTNIDVNAIIFCKNTPIQFSSNSNLSNIIYEWNFDDPITGPLNISDQQNPIHLFSKEGNYTIRLISKAECSVDTDYISITIKGINDLNPSISTMEQLFCIGDTVLFNGNGNISDASVRWEFGDPASGVENTASDLNTKHKFSGVGKYKIYFIIQNICGSDTDSVNITIIDKIIFNSQINTNTTKLCEGETLTFSIINVRPDVMYSWNFDDPMSGSNNTSNSQSPIHTFSTYGIFEVVLKTENKCNVELDTLKILVLEKKAINTTIYTIRTTYCITETINFNASSSDNNAKYFWDFSDPLSGSNNSSSLNNPSHIFSNIGMYTVKLKSTNDCNEEIDSIKININPNSKADFNYNVDSCSGIIQLFNNSENLEQNTYHWILENNIISSSIDTNYKLSNDGIYNVKLVSNPTTDCSDTVQKQIVFNAYTFDGNLVVPNTFSPNSDGINDMYEIKNDSECFLVKMSVYNRYGRKLYESTNDFSWDGRINDEKLPAGSYIIYLEFKEKTITKVINLIY